MRRRPRRRDVFFGENSADTIFNFHISEQKPRCKRQRLYCSPFRPEKKHHPPSPPTTLSQIRSHRHKSLGIRATSTVLPAHKHFNHHRNTHRYAIYNKRYTPRCSISARAHAGARILCKAAYARQQQTGRANDDDDDDDVVANDVGADRRRRRLRRKFRVRFMVCARAHDNAQQVWRRPPFRTRVLSKLRGRTSALCVRVCLRSVLCAARCVSMLK